MQLTHGYLRWQNLCGSILTVYVSRPSYLYTTTSYLKVHQLHEFAICTNSQGGNKRQQLISKFVQFTGVHFSNLNPNSYVNLNNRKLDLNVSTKIKLCANDQAFQFKNQGNYRFLLLVLLCIFYRALICTFAKMKHFTHELQLYRYLIYCHSSRIIEILPNVRSTINGKAPDFKNKLLPPSCFSMCSYVFHYFTLTYLFWCFQN